MNRLEFIQQQLVNPANLLVLAAAAVALAALYRRGLLAPGAIQGPGREIGLGPGDLLIAVGLMFVGQALLQLAVGPAAGGLAAGDPTAGGETPGAEAEVLTLPAALGMVVLGQLLTQAPTVALLAGRGIRAGGRNGLRRIGLLPRRPLRELGVAAMANAAALPIMLAVGVVATLLAALIAGEEPPRIAHRLLPAFHETGHPLARVGLILAVTVVAPILEEAVYRGLLQSTLVEMLGRRRRWLAVLIASTVFTWIHLGSVTVHALLALLGLAIMLGWLYERTGSLWPSIGLHAGFNALNIAMVILLVPPPG